MRISRQYLSAENGSSTIAKICLEPPTPEKLFQQIWEKQGYSNDEDVFKDFMSLLHEAQKSLEEQQIR